jgi:hypothetical protein
LRRKGAQSLQVKPEVNKYSDQIEMEEMMEEMEKMCFFPFFCRYQKAVLMFSCKVLGREHPSHDQVVYTGKFQI